MFLCFRERRDEDEFVWFMDDVETCRSDEWFATDVKSGEPRPKPAPFDQDFYLVLNMVRAGREGKARRASRARCFCLKFHMPGAIRYLVLQHQRDLEQ